MLAGRYRITATLGQGAVGKLLRAEDAWADAALVAIKLLSPPVTDWKTQALESEFRVLREISHPYIVEAYDFGRLGDGRAYFTMEHVAGTDILHLWPRLQPAEGLDLLLEICAALQCIHAAGYVHGDLKAENILIQDPPGRMVKLVDFGHAAALGARGLQLRGTPEYAPPEVLTGDAANARSDLYSLGVLLYRLLSGRFPFGEGAAAAKAHLEHRPPALILDPRLGIARSRLKPLAPIVGRLLAKRPEQRPSDVGELARALEDVRRQPQVSRPSVRRKTRMPAPSGPRAPFVGRRTFLVRLEAALEQMIRKQLPGAAVLTGPSGIGKSRILDVFKTTCQLHDCLVLPISCTPEAGGSGTGAAIARLLELLCSALPPAPDTVAACGTELLKVAPRLADRPDFFPVAARVKGRVPGTRPLPPRAERMRHWDRVAEFFVRQAQRRPLVLCFQEAEHGGQEIPALVAALERRTDPTPILICLTSAASPQPEWFPRPGQSNLDSTLLPVDGLNVTEATDLVRALLRGAWWERPDAHPRPPTPAVSRTLTRRMHLLTKGNPLRMIELARGLMRTVEPSEWNRPAVLARIPIPADLAASMRMQLRSLSPGAARMLRYLTHTRRPVSQQVLVDAWRRRKPGKQPAAATEAESGLLELVEAGLASRRKQGDEIRCDLTDPRHAAAVAALTSRTERRRLHAELAAALQRLRRSTPPSATEHAGLLEQQALHLLEAGDAQRGVRCSLQAAREARKLHAYRHALELLQRCLPATRGGQPHKNRRGAPGSQRRKVEILLEMGDLASLLGDPATEEKALQGLRSPACKALLKRVELARVHRRRGALAMIHGRHPQASRLLARADRLLGNARGIRGAEAKREKLRVAAATAMLHIHQGASAQALETCREALRTITPTGSIETAVRKQGLGGEIASLLNFSAIANLYLGNPSRALRSWARAHRTYRLSGEPAGMAGILNNLGKFHMDRGDLRRARAALRRAIAQRQRLRDIDGVADSLNNLGIVEIMSGHLPRARRLLELGRNLRRRVGDRFGETLALANLGEVDLLMGRYAAAEEKLEKALEFMRAAGHARLCRGLSNSLAAVSLATGRRGRAERALKQIISDAAASHDRLQQGIALIYLGQCALEQHRAADRRQQAATARARKHLTEALEIFADLPHRYHQGLAIAHLAQVRQTTATGAVASGPPGTLDGSDDTSSRGHLARIARNLGSATLLARSHLLHGNHLLQILRDVAKRPSRQDLETVLTAFDQARQTAQKSGLREVTWQAHLGSARAWRLAGRYRRAHNHLREALGILTEMQQELRGKRLRGGFLRSCGRADVQREVELLAAAAGLAPE